VVDAKEAIVWIALSIDNSALSHFLSLTSSTEYAPKTKQQLQTTKKKKQEKRKNDVVE